MKNAICWRHIHLQSFFPAHFSLIRAVSCVQVGWPHLPDAIRGYSTCRVHITSPHLDVTYRSVAVCCQRCNRGYLCKHEARQTNVTPQHYEHHTKGDQSRWYAIAGYTLGHFKAQCFHTSFVPAVTVCIGPDVHTVGHHWRHVQAHTHTHSDTCKKEHLWSQPYRKDQLLHLT